MKEIIALELDLGLGQSIKSYDQFIAAQAQVQRQIIEIREANKDLNKELRDQIKVAADLRARQAAGDQQAAKDLESLLIRREQISKQLVVNQKRLKELGAEQRKLNTTFGAIDDARDAYQQLSDELRTVRQRVKAIKAEGGIVDPADLARVQQLDKQLKDIDASVGQFQRNVGNYGSVFEGLTSVLDVSAFTSIAGAAAAAGQVLVETTKYVFQITEEFRVLRGEIEQLTGATGTALDSLSSRVASIATTFGQTNSEVIESANAVSKQLGIPFEQALAGIEEGFIAGSNRSGEFLDSLKEYPAFFREAELPASALFRVINESANQGIYSDKGVDTIKEATLRIRENATATQAALKGIGISNEELRKVIETDGIGGAIAVISQRLGELEADSPEVGAAIAGIFGGPGEDAGLQFLLSLKDINNETESLIDETNEYQVQQLKTLEINRQFAEVQNEIALAVGGAGANLSNLGTIIKTELLRFVVLIIDNFKTLVGIFTPLGEALYDVGLTLGIFSKELGFTQNLINALKEGFEIVTTPLRILVGIITGGVKVIGAFISAGREFLEWLGVVEAKAEGTSGGIDEIVSGLDSANLATDEVIAKNTELAKSESDLQKSIENSSKKLSTTIKKNREELAGQAGSIARARQEIAQLNKQIEETGDLELKIKLTQDVDELENTLAVQEALVQRAIDKQKGLLGDIRTGENSIPLLGVGSGEELTAQIDKILEITDIANKARVEREKETQALITEAREESEEAFIQKRGELFQMQLQQEEERLEKLAQLNAETIEGLGSVLGDFFSGQTESFKDFQKGLLLTTLDALEKAVQLYIIEAQIRELAKSGIAGILKGAILVGVIRALFSGARGLINRFDDGGILKGPSHEKGGIQIFSKSGAYFGEAEGDEAIINRKASTNPRALGILSRINEAFGGRRLGGRPMPDRLSEELIRYINVSYRNPISYNVPTRPIYQSGGLLQEASLADNLVVGDIDYDRLGEAVAKSISKLTIVTDIGQVGIEARNFNQLVQNAREI